MKNVTLLAVKHSALLLIERNKTTTTLEVKSLLRSLDYFAEQDEISAFMDVAAQELPLIFTTVHGQHRVYELPPVSAVSAVSADDDADDDATDTLLTAMTTTANATDDDLGGVSQDLYDAADFKYTSRKNELVLLYDEHTTIKDLGGKVTRISTGAGRSFYFTQPVRRELARSAHASILGVHKNGTRSFAVAV